MTRFEIVADDSKVWIEGSSSVHPVHAAANGLEGWVEVSFAGSNLRKEVEALGEIRIAVDRLRSGNALVDRETRRRIDAGRYPEIVGTVTSSRRLSADRLKLTGDLAFRGETRSVTGEVNVRRDGALVTIEGQQRLDVRDWGLQPPKVAMLRVHPHIEVRIRVVAELPKNSMTT